MKQQMIENERLKTVRNQLQSCKQCELSKLEINKQDEDYPDRGKVFSTGYSDAKIMFIGESPFFKRVVGNDGIIRPFNFGNEYEDNVGSGKILFNILWKLNVKREDIYITNLIKCSYNEKLRKNIQKYFAECFFLTKLEIALVKPKIIFLLGNEVHQFFETHKLMSIIPEQIIAISHPAFIYRSPGFKTKYEGIIKHHLTEAGLI